jgi:molybdopterin-containing oxidoreductase family membrane subunit
MWTAAVFAFISLILLIVPAARRKEGVLLFACISVIIATWIDKGFGLVLGGLMINPFEKVIEYWPTLPEMMISIGVWATGFLIITILYKIASAVKEEVGA